MEIVSRVYDILGDDGRFIRNKVFAKSRDLLMNSMRQILWLRPHGTSSCIAITVLLQQQG